MAVSAFPAAATNQVGIYNLQLYFQGTCGQGWSERYPVGIMGSTTESVSSFTNSQGAFTLACLRAMLLGKGSQIVWGRVSGTGKSREALPILSSPISAIAVGSETTTTIGDLNMTGDALYFQLRDASGHYSQRIFRGLRDDEVDQNAWVNAATVVPLGVTSVSSLTGLTSGYPAFTTAQATGASANTDAQYWALNSNSSAGITRSMAWTMFLQTLEFVTGYASKITKRATGQVVNNSNCNPWNLGANGILFRKATTKKSGKVFGASRGAAPKSK